MNGKIIAFPASAVNQEEKKSKKRKRGERKDGRIQRSWQYTRLDNGETDREWFYGHTGAEVDRKKAEFQKAYYEQKEEMERKKKELEELGPMAEYLGISVSGWLTAWMEKYKGEFNNIITESGYTSRINRINKFIGDMKIEDVRDIHIQPIFRDIAGKSKSLISKHYRILFNAFAKAAKNKIIKENPMEDFELPDGTEGTHRELEPWECDFIISKWRVHRSYRWALYMILTGSRTGEIAAMDPNDILLDKRTIRIDDSVTFGKNQPIRKGTTKTEAGVRDVPICDLLYELVEDSLRNAKETSLFRMTNGNPITKIGMRRAFETLNRHIEKYANETGNEFIAIRPHDCRHTYATALYDADVDVKTAQYLLGHKNIQTTLDLYTHLSERKMRKGVKSLVTYLNKWVTEIPPQESE